MELASRWFWWKGMAVDVTLYCKACTSCQLMKSSTQLAGGPLQPLEVPAFPWSSVSMDFITCLPISPSGNDTLIVWVDRLTKYVIVQPCKLTIDAPGFAQMTVDHVISKHGCPESFVSDRDVRFTAAFMQSLTTILGVQQKMSTAFHPQTDGQTERMNRLLEETLRHFVSFTQHDWDSQIQMVAFAINNAHNISIGHTPFFLNKGLHPRLPCGICDLPSASELEPKAVSFSVTMQGTLAMARRCLLAAQSRQKAQADKHARVVTFKEGELVLLSTKNLKLKNDQNVVARQKLLPKFIGPYKILKCIGPVAYKLDLPGTTRIHSVFHVMNLRQFVPPLPGTTLQPPCPLDWLDPDPLFTIDSLVGHSVVKRGNKCTYLYKVHWSGFSPLYDSFEPRDTLLEAVPEMLAGYELLHSLAIAARVPHDPKGPKGPVAAKPAKHEPVLFPPLPKGPPKPSTAGPRPGRMRTVPAKLRL